MLPLDFFYFFCFLSFFCFLWDGSFKSISISPGLFSPLLTDIRFLLFLPESALFQSASLPFITYWSRFSFFNFSNSVFCFLFNSYYKKRTKNLHINNIDCILFIAKYKKKWQGKPFRLFLIPRANFVPLMDSIERYPL